MSFIITLLIIGIAWMILPHKMFWVIIGLGLLLYILTIPVPRVPSEEGGMND